MTVARRRRKPHANTVVNALVAAIDAGNNWTEGQFVSRAGSSQIDGYGKIVFCSVVVGLWHSSVVLVVLMMLSSFRDSNICDSRCLIYSSVTAYSPILVNPFNRCSEPPSCLLSDETGKSQLSYLSHICLVLGDSGSAHSFLNNTQVS